ncbi:MAG: hypothetical protein H8D42_01970 [Candidatus Marinimicrobia bacterium]|nr:hypothetical protein [Candidatus Neomarinimicrobiota bacterium]
MTAKKLTVNNAEDITNNLTRKTFIRKKISQRCFQIVLEHEMPVKNVRLRSDSAKNGRKSPQSDSKIQIPNYSLAALKFNTLNNSNCG